MSIPVKIYVEDHGTRHDFTFGLIFNQLLGSTYEYSDKESCDLNYSDQSSNGINCKPFGLLEEDSIDKNLPSRIQFENWDDIPVFFKTSESTMPFDIFSASFFLVSRYEEYTIESRDDHGRFSATDSVLFKAGVLEEPLVNRWALKLLNLLLLQNQEIDLEPRQFEYISTIDVDQTFKFKHKGIARVLGATLSDLITGKWENFKARWPVIAGIKKDPFNNFDWQFEVHDKHRIDAIYFWLLGNRSKFDKNISSSNREQKKIIQTVKDLSYSEVGIHPSYKSNSVKNKVKDEIDKLEGILKDDVTLSRQHFLVFDLPNTYQQLVEHGIKHEHSMGYSTHLGFRAGIASPFKFFNLTTNEEKDMMIYPFCMMDITPLHYMNLNPEKATEAISSLIAKVKAVGGLCISLWHNESFSETERWKGWRVVYERMLEEVNQ